MKTIFNLTSKNHIVTQTKKIVGKLCKKNQFNVYLQENLRHVHWKNWIKYKIKAVECLIIGNNFGQGVIKLNLNFLIQRILEGIGR